MVNKIFHYPAAILIMVLIAGCNSVSSYIGKNREEIVNIITADYNQESKQIHIFVPRGSNYYFDHPSEILNKNLRTWGPDMTKFNQWGILPYKKFLYDGTFCTMLTFENDIVIKEENDFFCGGYGFKPFLFFVFLLYPFI